MIYLILVSFGDIDPFNLAKLRYCARREAGTVELERVGSARKSERILQGKGGMCSSDILTPYVKGRGQDSGYGFYPQIPHWVYNEDLSQ